MSQRRTLPPTYFLGSLIAMVVLHLFVPVTRWLAFPWNLLGLAPLMVGGWLNAVCSRAFDHHTTTVKPFEESTVLLAEGPFKYSRNPMYLGMVLVLSGVGLLFGTASPVMAIPLFAWLMTTRFIVEEEKALTQSFGQPYLDYKGRVRRWL